MSPVCLHRRFVLVALFAAVALLGLSGSVLGFDPDVVPFSDKFPVVIYIADHASVYEIGELGIDIDTVGDGWIRAYVNRAEVQLIQLLGYTVKRIPNQALEMWRTLQEQEGDTKDEWDNYHNYAAMTTYLQGVAADHPDITRLISIGQSVQGRELWFMKITDNPDVQEDEPEFKYISTMHGDEPPGTENCLQFIELLTDNYESPTPDPDLERLVNEVELWIMPMMNPDGNNSGSRYNAHGTDLNRDFPDWVTDPNNTPDGREPETQVVMVFSDTMSFDLSANFHTGALVVNYPWDNRFPRTPDDDLFIFMSESYSIHNSPMWNSSSFYHGITNGADWYVIHGGMQDWNYDWLYNKEVTIELNDVKWPSASHLPQLWDDNDEAMAAYIENTLLGVRGLVTDASTGDPLAATVEVDGNAWIDRTDPDVGDYHRILLPGTYTLTFAAGGHLPATFAGVVVDGEEATVLDVQLGTTAQFEITGTVTTDSRAPLMAKVEAFYHMSGNPADSTTSSPVDGSYTLNVSPSEYDIRAWATGYAPGHEFADVQGDTTFDFVLESVSGIILVIDNDEGKRLLEKKDGFEVETVVKGEKTSAADLAADLAVLGYEVVEETSAGTDPAAWPTYDLVVWSCGSNTSPVSSSIRRGNLIDFVDSGGNLLIEGGEVAYDAVGYPGYPNFADSVLHVDDWNGDQVGNLWLVPAQSEHPIATEPNPLPGTINIDFLGWGSQDAAHPAGGAYIVYGNTSRPADAGVLVYDGAKAGDRSGVVFLSFSYPAIGDRAAAKDLLQNVATYMMSEMTSVECVSVGRSEVALDGAFPNPFNPLTTISFSVQERQRVHLAVYDVQGRLVSTLIDGVVEAGPQEVTWDARDEAGKEIASGVYFCRLLAAEGRYTKKIVKLN
ncbi:MAG: T9SS type A sorting domain-containing protein [Candidatus Eisenbacteria sp.]|nr:T9SS type A sorting domain-containing protein [Candidatus Eisenbacteria bacterium]